MTADHTVRDAEDPAVAALFARLPDPAARDELASRFLPLAEHLARRFGGRGQQHDDLVQVASLGLVHAIDRFDPDRGVRFSTFATATIVGELKRYFRDRGWGVRVPRLHQRLAGRARGRLRRRCRRPAGRPRRAL
jgi:RNA polymerase sigma-B factor